MPHPESMYQYKKDEQGLLRKDAKEFTKEFTKEFVGHFFY